MHSTCPSCGSDRSVPAHDVTDRESRERRCMDCATKFTRDDMMRPMGAGSEVRARAAREFKVNPRGIPKHKELPPGTRVRVADGSGLDSRKKGVVIAPVTDHRGIAKTTHGGEFQPFDRRRERMVRYDDGETGTMFLSRLIEIEDEPVKRSERQSGGSYLRGVDSETGVVVEKVFPSGAWEVSDIIDNHRVSMRYMDHTRQEAIDAFVAEFGTSDGEYHENAGAKMRPAVEDYETANRALGTRDEVSIGNNTRLRREDDSNIAVVLHRTPIVTYRIDGLMELNSGGHRTVTTKARMNEVTPAWLTIYQKGGEWFVREPGSGGALRFEDGMVVGHQ